MKIYSSPFRVSLFGGGTDYPSFFNKNLGSVLGFTIDKHLILLINKYKNLDDQKKYKLVYSKIEECDHHNQIEHPLFNKIPIHLDKNERVEIIISSDIPGHGGLGSSSALSTCYAYHNLQLTKNKFDAMDVACEGIKYEREILNEIGGIQDQLHCSYGNVNMFTFLEDKIVRHKVNLNHKKIQILDNSMVLVRLSGKRLASIISQKQSERTIKGQNDSYLTAMTDFSIKSKEILESCQDSCFLEILGEQLTINWELKKKLSNLITNEKVDDIIERGVNLGALGAKLCGAGASGYILFIVPKDIKEYFKLNIKHPAFDIKISNEGTRHIR